jgi:glycosyltransferase involved in cell wall biosynthesis
MRILILSPYFAPDAAVGAKRFSFLAHQFEQLGHEVEIIAWSCDASGRRDDSLPSPSRVHRPNTLLPHRLASRGVAAKIYAKVMDGVVATPDEFIGWLPPTILTGRRIARRWMPDVVIATGPPFTMFLAGGLLSRSIGAPLVLDYRDPWTAFDWLNAKSRNNTRISKRLERWAVGRADALVFTSDSIEQEFEAKFAGATNPRRSIITNGFNDPLGLEPRPLSPNAINLLYAGNFYDERKMSPLVDAIRIATDDGPLKNKKFAVHVFGTIKADDWDRIEAIGLRDIVHEHAPVSHAEVLGYMKAADVLYLPWASRMTYALFYKVFDYLSVKRPVLVASKPGAMVAKFIESLDCGESVIGESPEAIAKGLERILSPDRSFTFAGREKFAWEQLAQRYVELLEDVAKRRRACP